MHKNTMFIDALQAWAQAFMHHSMRAFIHYIKEQNLSMSQIGALFHIKHKGSCGVSDISEDLGVTNAAVSQMLERLVQQGLIHRAEDPRDRRAKRIELTNAGHTFLQDAMKARLHWFETLAGTLSEEEQERAGHILQLLADKTKELEKAKS